MNNQLEVLCERMVDCESCDLYRERTQVVFGEGSMKPKVMIIGEAPGEEEDKRGIPFVGKAGDKLDKILNYVGLSREEIYITNSVLCRPPNNRNPNSEELSSCRWRLQLQIQILRPELIIVLGRVAMQQLGDKPIKGALSQFFPENIDGDWLNYETKGHKAKVLVSYHPSYLLRSPERGYKTVLPHWKQVKRWLENE